MGKRGPAPHPTNIKYLHGVDKKNPARVNRDEPVPDQNACPEPPSRLSNKAKVMWRRLAPDLHRKGVLTGWDVDAFAETCEAAINMRLAQETLNKEGLFVTTSKGDLANHPAMKTVRDNWTIFIQGAGRFGLTPSDRSQLKLGEMEQKDPTADLLTG